MPPELMLIDQISPPEGGNLNRRIKIINLRKQGKYMDECETRDKIDAMLAVMENRLESLRYGCYELPMDMLSQMIEEYSTTSIETMDQIRVINEHFQTNQDA